MKQAAVLILASLAIAGAQLPAIHSVYLFPMANGMDQYLASLLSSSGTLQVVTDPAKADAVLTDRLGEPFERRMAEMYPAELPAPPPAKPESKSADKQDKQEKDKDKAAKDTQEEPAAASIPEAPPVPASSFSRGKGNFFLVSVKSRAVVWSVYERPRGLTPDDLNRSAKRVVDRLSKSLSGQ